MNEVADPLQVRLDRLRRLVPLPLLAVSTAASFAIPGAARSRLLLEASLVVAAALWSAFVSARLPAGTPLPRRLAAYAVHTPLAAVLVGTNLCFGIFAYSGFLFAYPLGRRWRLAAFAVTALIVSASLAGGYPVRLDGHGLTYLIVAGVMLALVLNSASITNHALAQNEERGRMIAENARLHEQLLTQARHAGVIEERQRLAGEIHDTLAQGLTGIIAQLAAAEHVRHDPGQLSRHLELAQSLARANLAEARRSVRALRPGQLEQAGLPAALGELAREWSASSGISAEFQETGARCRVPDEVETILFRVAQEALANAAKHSGARQVNLTLTCLDDAVLLDVHDDGTGFDAAAETDGYGLPGMRHRLAKVGGTLTVESSAGYGTTLNASVPLR
ncbi:signal transduction histidine kinase [Amycolatopsis bartoniae]|uniref:Histidine kinase n=1 Tax=Amycolatopsis bartoniae TaxID=941986 RepID=A0A8H9IZU0_9PSEU|nr:sensor histidine kinase [Amycolatopsis bartoniae]MBB2934122.1 signal transduction histidine kinase [Amycolatopsis bartoniae]TVT05504.1 sensor histidine kinase [Amycolatopsis bartoniae]GHF84197.1 histidine kinase [Amycolatopsis bartoniae]